MGISGWLGVGACSSGLNFQLSYSFESRETNRVSCDADAARDFIVSKTRSFEITKTYADRLGLQDRSNSLSH